MIEPVGWKEAVNFAQVIGTEGDPFLVACYATLPPALSVCPSVRPSVRRSVTLYFFWVFGVFGITAPAQMIW